MARRNHEPQEEQLDYEREEHDGIDVKVDPSQREMKQVSHLRRAVHGPLPRRGIAQGLWPWGTGQFFVFFLGPLQGARLGRRRLEGP
jgi:hypothetical protein